MKETYAYIGIVYRVRLTDGERVVGLGVLNGGSGSIKDPGDRQAGQTDPAAPKRGTGAAAGRGVHAAEIRRDRDGNL